MNALIRHVDALGLVVIPVACAVLAFLAGLVLRQRETLLGYFGAGWLGNLLASAVRSALKIDPWRAIGIADPLLWVFGGCLVVLLVVRGPRRWWDALLARRSHGAIEGSVE